MTPEQRKAALELLEEIAPGDLKAEAEKLISNLEFERNRFKDKRGHLGESYFKITLIRYLDSLK